MLLLSEWQNELQPCRRAGPARITLWVIRRVINTFRPHKIHVCVDFFFEEKEKQTVSFEGPRSELSFFAVTETTQESTWSTRRVCPGDRAGHLVCFQHETTASSLTCSFAGFPLAKLCCGIAGPSGAVPWEGSPLHRQR